MADEERDDSERVDRRAFFRGAGRKSIARATNGGMRGGLFSWAIARAEAIAPKDEDETEVDWYLEDIEDFDDADAVIEEADAEAGTGAAFVEQAEEEEWHGVDLSGGPPPPPPA